MADVFISYAREDHEIAAQLAQLLEGRGWNVWWDRDLVPGESFDEVIEQELTGAKAVIVLWSAVSVQSRWVRSEANAAVERGSLIPVVLDGTAVPLRFRIVQGVDLAGWDRRDDDPRVASLYAGVQALAGPPPAPSHMAPPFPSSTSPSPPRLAPPHPSPPTAPPPTVALPPIGDDSPDRDIEVAVGSRATTSAGRPPRRRSRLAILGVLAAVIVVVVLFAVVRSTGDDDEGEATGSGPASSAAPGATDAPTAATDAGEVDAAGPAIDPALVLEEGDESDDVSEIQQWLRDSGTDPDLRVDGIFGPLTDRAVRMFEGNNKLPVDGRLVIEGDEWQQLRTAAETAQSSTTSTTSSPITDGPTPVPDVYRLIADSAVQELQAAGFEVDVDAGCSNSVDEGLVRQVTYQDDGTKIVVVGTAGEIDARDAPAGILLSVLVSTGLCS